MASSLLSSKSYSGLRTPRGGDPRWLPTVSAVVSIPSPRSLGLERGGFTLGKSFQPTILRGFAKTVVRNGVAGAVSSMDERPIVVIDNYDSFTYNLCQYLGELGVHFETYRNDEITVDEIKRINPRGILISPGPGTPQDSGISLQTVLELGPSIPLFGVCMGLQCIGEAFGGKIVRAPSGVMHGKSSLVYYDESLDDTLFHGLPNPFTACRYHSLVIEKESFPSDSLEITAWTEDGLIMAARHKKLKHIQGVQFHPESIMTPEGRTMVGNFIKSMDKLKLPNFLS
ncbi:anthranilate synthase beta subunit 2, chloroplastic-like [Zingiber officinale]|uniref:anthranilate synthase beta subunit 2, chloroplastic-like n=1 Tax=Zingiber officinale TaxID=94328 RepID=UPI001C4AE6A7|nr:anthranilate synthase beta subunit 2, chloroplastic-like [Zingiber officinale]